jgi:hypothetical protein
MKKLSKKIALICTLFIIATFLLSGCGSTTNSSNYKPSQESSSEISSSLPVSSSSSIITSSEAATNSHSQKWDYKNQMGYSFEVEILVWDPITDATKDTLHPYNIPDTKGQDSLGSSVSFDPTTDLVIPAAFFIMSTTQKAKILVGMNATIPNSDVEVEQFFENGPHVTTLSPNSNSTIGVQWASPFTYEQPGENAFFIIVHNYYTSSYPNGNKALLDQYKICPVSYWQSSTDNTGAYYIDGNPVNYSNTSGITLSGKIVK